MKLKFAYRDEIVNIFAMTCGFENLSDNFQLILCKKNPNPHKGPFLLDPKKTKAVFKLSNLGSYNEKSILNELYSLEYVAFIDSYIQIRVDYDLFENLSDRFFQVWDPIAPYSYFENLDEGFLVLFRVYKIAAPINEILLEKGRGGRNYYYKLKDLKEITLVEPVLEEENFLSIKTDLLKLTKPWIENIIENELNVDISGSVSSDILQRYEDVVLQIAKEKDLDSLYEIIRNKMKKIKQRTIEIEVEWRDHDVSKYVKMRAKGRCENCNNPAPFINENGEPYLESHHLKPLSEGGLDTVMNTVGICPNCHRRFHHSKDKRILTEKLLNKIQEIEKEKSS